MKWARQTTAAIGMFLAVTSVAACGAPAAPAAAPAADAGGTAAAAAPASAPAGKPNTLTAVKVDAASLDAAAGYWAKAPVTAVATKATKEGNPTARRSTCRRCMTTRISPCGSSGQTQPKAT